MKTIVLLFFRRMCGLIVIPFLYARYSFIFFLPLLFLKDVPNDIFFAACFIYVIVFGFIMGNCEVMQYWTKLFQWIFKVKYDILGQWTSDIVHSHSMWSHPILKVRGKEYKLSIVTMGANIYDESDVIRRKAIVYYLLY